MSSKPLVFVLTLFIGRRDVGSEKDLSTREDFSEGVSCALCTCRETREPR